jgi:hypothetical protein
MGMTAAIIGGVGGLSAVFGIVSIFEVMPPFNEALDWIFWFFLSVILFLASIAISMGRGGYVE